MARPSLRPWLVRTQTTRLPASRAPEAAQPPRAGHRRRGGRLRVDPLATSEVEQRLSHLRVGDGDRRAAAPPDRLVGVVAGNPMGDRDGRCSGRTSSSGCMIGVTALVGAHQGIGADRLDRDHARHPGREAEAVELVEPLPDPEEIRACPGGHDDILRRIPAELLGDLEGRGLVALGLVGGEIVHPGPAELLRERRRQARERQHRRLGAQHGRAVRAHLAELLEVDLDPAGGVAARRHEKDDGGQARPRGGRRHGGADVPGRHARQGVGAERPGDARRDADRPVLERARRVLALDLRQEPDGQARAETRERNETSSSGAHVDPAVRVRRPAGAPRTSRVRAAGLRSRSRSSVRLRARRGRSRRRGSG